MRFKAVFRASAQWILSPVLALTLMLPALAQSAGQSWGSDYFPNFELTAHTGEKLRFFDDIIEGKVVAINFIFTSCSDVCPMETARMRSVFNLLGDRVGEDVHFYSITIDPKHDTVEVLNDYVEKFKIDGDRWKFLTGDKREIDFIRKRFGLYSNAVEEAQLSNHNINLVIGNQSTGHWVKRSPFENPYILANQLGSWLHGWRKVDKHTFTEKNFAAAPEVRQITDSEMLFRDRCTSCHVVALEGQGGDHIGPNLFGVTRARDPDWLRAWLKDPAAMVEAGDPIATALYDAYEIMMPNFRLEPRQIEMLLEYIHEETLRLEELGQLQSQMEMPSDLELQSEAGLEAEGKLQSGIAQTTDSELASTRLTTTGLESN